MTDILLVLILLADVVQIFLLTHFVEKKYKARKLTKEEERQIAKAKRELDNFYAYNGDSQAE